MKSNLNYLCFLFFFSSLFSLSGMAQSSDAVLDLQHRWAEVNYNLNGDEQLSAFQELREQAEQVTSLNPDLADAWIWSGIIKSTFAGVKGGLGALSLAKQARRDLEQAMELDPDALEGSAYTSLGTLYYSVPGWPVGFGDNDKAEELLKKALSIAPHSIDANYFYAEFERDRKNYDEARIYYLKAQAAPAREGRELADTGRREEIRRALELLDK